MALPQTHHWCCGFIMVIPPVGAHSSFELLYKRRPLNAAVVWSWLYFSKFSVFQPYYSGGCNFFKQLLNASLDLQNLDFDLPKPLGYFIFVSMGPINAAASLNFITSTPKIFWSYFLTFLNSFHSSKFLVFLVVDIMLCFSSCAFFMASCPFLISFYPFFIFSFVVTSFVSSWPFFISSYHCCTTSVNTSNVFLGSISSPLFLVVMVECHIRVKKKTIKSRVILFLLKVEFRYANFVHVVCGHQWLS